MNNSIKNFIIKILGKKLFLTFRNLYRHCFPAPVAAHELRYMREVAKFIPTGQVVVDIGANIGVWTKFLSEHIGDAGQVLAFEPIVDTCRYLEKQCRHCRNVKFFQVALSNKSGKEKMLVDELSFAPASAGISSTADQLKDPGSHFKTIEITTESLDNLLSSQGINEVSFIKCDVEGHEKNVILGSKTTIEKCRPILFIEILREKWLENGPGDSETSRMLQAMGYAMGQPGVTEIVFVKDKFNSKCEDFIFVPKDQLP